MNPKNCPIQLDRPYKLENASIEENLTKKSTGVFTLGTMSERADYLVAYAGRAEKDLKKELTSLVGQTRRPLFTFEYTSSAKEAFEKQCRIYHYFEPPDNKSHPQPPEGKSWNCPTCS
ncbi:MAG: hypothetical protein GF421_04945 [Candidatus Aminicenantes bacterium]|nr:hypothetical protein [Candidatus Aminicenantes bacterium]